MLGQFYRRKKFRVIIIFTIILLIFTLFWNIYRAYYTTETTISIDENGLVLRDYGIKRGIFIGEHYNPVFSSRYALDFYQEYIQTGNSTAKQYLLNNADWIIDNVENRYNYSIYTYDFPWPDYGIYEEGWVDAMAQTRMMMVLIKAHEITGDEKYLNVADQLLNALYVEVDARGVTYKNEDGWWYEHFAHPNGTKPMVLNAHLTVLLELDKYIKYTQSDKAKFLFEKGLESAKNQIKYYDLNGYSFLNRVGDPSTFSYHKIHVNLTDRLYNITGEDIFKEYHDRWERCDWVCKNYNFYSKYIQKQISVIVTEKNI